MCPLKETMTDPAKRGVLGLANLGNTCFLNAAVQALRSNREWTLFIIKKQIDEYWAEGEKPCKKTAKAYIELLHSLWGGSGPGYVIPKGFRDQMCEVVRGTVYEDFSRRQPQDAHEFLVWLLDQQFMATQSEITIHLQNPDRMNPMQVGALKAWKENFEKAYSPLVDLIFGLLRIQYKCHACKTTHTRWETFNTLKYSLFTDAKQQPLSLLENLQQEFHEEVIPEYACDTCAPKRADATKSISIWRLPKFLILTAKRFSPTGYKIQTPVAPFEEVSFGEVFAPESTEASKDKKYRLFATVDHHGSHHGGHYTAQAKNFLNDTWYFYDDESASPLEKPFLGRSTYMMFLTQT